MINREAAQREYELVQRALAGDQEAWRLLFEDQQPRLLAKVRQLLGPMRRNDDLAEEVAARVWSAVLADDRHLLRVFDPQRGRLGTFLGRRAYFEMLVLCRAHKCRSQHETSYQRSHTEEVTMPLPELVWQELNECLTDRERSFLNDYLLRCPPTSEPVAPLYHVRMRIRRKVRAYLEGA